MAKKYDGVIEAVHYKNGQIVNVRAYERRGSAFSDSLLIDRKDLLERIKSGKQFVVGVRKEFWAGSFDESKAVQLVTRNGKDFIATRADAEHDELESAPVF
jgi:hypothetical protein